MKPEERSKIREVLGELHETLVSDAFLDVMAEAKEDEQVREALQADPRAYLQERGIRLRDEIKVDTKDKSWCIGFSFWLFWWWDWWLCF